jgi:hypothetical protein
MAMRSVAFMTIISNSAVEVLKSKSGRYVLPGEEVITQNQEIFK